MDIPKIKRRQPNIGTAILLFIVLGLAFFVTSRHISDLATESCFRTLHQSTQQLSRELRKNVEGTSKILAMAADELARYEAIDSQETREFLSSFQEGELISRLELLLPGDRVLQSDGRMVDAAGVLSFQVEKDQGTHISSRETELDDTAHFILRSYMPVVRNGETIAMLYGVMDLKRFAEYYTVEPLAEGFLIHLIEGKSGNFLLNTVHDTLGNAAGLRNRQPKRGYTADQVITDLAAGQSGRTAFRSQTFGEFYYCDYAPVGVNDWMVMITMPESMALADAHQIRATLYLLAGWEAAVFMAYFLWLLSRAKRNAAQKESQLHLVQYMLDIEGTLFGAAQNPTLIETALAKVADKLRAEGSFFLVCKPLQDPQTFVFHAQWEDADCHDLMECFLSLGPMIEPTEGLVSYELASLLKQEPAAYELIQRLKMHSLMLLPVPDSHGNVIGVLGAVNMEKHWTDTEILKSVILSFLTALNLLESFRMVQEMGLMDHLTGLLNRNSFQLAMEALERDPDDSLACVYIDVDGLHEFNNQCGHMSGDQMLQSVAAALKTAFGTQQTYRIGGDEFLVFTLGLSEEQVEEKIQASEQTVMAQGYHISTGVAWRRNIPLVYNLVRQAETQMYAAKRSYYEKKNNTDVARERNCQLEALLTEKRDLDAFRSVLAGKYKGVYVVSLSLDTMRPIYIPPYFAALMEETGGKFSHALQRYIDGVLPDFQEVLTAFMDFTQVRTWLDQGKTPALRYQKKDGSSILLQIYPSPNYPHPTKESIWVFGDLDAEW